ncbi:hypothetical protein RJT34_33056 [Clitoria ternatea]|uniref:Uncharacterized protein n=1 Tax=Clitoria ternatea TaxID=43366 RepID=A0AAN9IA32_CLITE
MGTLVGEQIWWDKGFRFFLAHWSSDKRKNQKEKEGEQAKDTRGKLKWEHNSKETNTGEGKKFKTIDQEGAQGRKKEREGEKTRAKDSTQTGQWKKGSPKGEVALRFLSLAKVEGIRLEKLLLSPGLESREFELVRGEKLPPNFVRREKKELGTICEALHITRISYA